MKTQFHPTLGLAAGLSLCLSITLLLSTAPATPAAPDAPPPQNPRIAPADFLANATPAFALREKNRLSEAEFLLLSRESGTIILDARSPEKYLLLHIEGAINLTFADIDEASLQRVLPDKSARILIYCNNNFADDPRAFPSKLPGTSLNLSTFLTLYAYGYRNLYELAPLLSVKTTLLPLAGSEIIENECEGR